MAEMGYLETFLALGRTGRRDREGFWVYGPEGKRPSQLLEESRRQEQVSTPKGSVREWWRRDQERENMLARDREAIEVEASQQQGDIADLAMETKGTFLWECCDDDSNLQDFFENALPENYTYKVTKLKMLEESDISKESRFMANFKVNVCASEEVETFIKDLENKTETQYLPDRSQTSRGAGERYGKKWTSRKYHCIRKVRDQRSKPEEKKRMGSGKQKGEERQPGKGTNCKANFAYKFF